ncbi:hypothetical protein L9F63_023066, partial [Diploptera punctata]
MDIYLQRTWVEDRLILKETLQENRFYIVDKMDTEKFWIPDLYIQNMADFTTNHGNLDLQLLMLNNKKRVVRGQ